MNSLKKVAACIKRNKSFLITAHTNLEGDALGSELAFAELLRLLGKKAVIVNDDKIPVGYEFLSGVDSVHRYKPGMKVANFDCFVLLDCSDLKRCGDVYKLNKFNKPVLNIDHHISNTYFADISWVEPHVSSCAEQVYKLFKAMRVPLNKKSALALYVGILTDTGSFRYSTTSAFTHQAAADLLRYGIDVARVYRNIYEDKPYQDMVLLAGILSGIKRVSAGKIAWVEIEKGVTHNKTISFDLSERVLSFLRAIKDVEVAVLFKKIQGRNNEVRINLRSQGKIDVNKIAQFFGGGGHKTASGCTVRGTLAQVKKKVLTKIKGYLR
ncbi:MAG: bifunctional oligoribonuclease/PAP phosphatase NrnA [Candidatus Omnitrophica bacterium]|jgi:phosphoesterase RecJ-like protein|nr:bifunctional oligoribonuclease/PAP phosphatase NrnA [Candidatus Omnitrophota bacterium]